MIYMQWSNLTSNTESGEEAHFARRMQMELFYQSPYPVLQIPQMGNMWMMCAIIYLSNQLAKEMDMQCYHLDPQNILVS